MAETITADCNSLSNGGNLNNIDLSNSNGFEYTVVLSLMLTVISTQDNLQATANQISASRSLYFNKLHFHPIFLIMNELVK